MKEGRIALKKTKNKKSRDEATPPGCVSVGGPLQSKQTRNNTELLLTILRLLLQYLSPLSSNSVLLPLLLPPPPPPVTSVSVGQGQRVLTPHTSGIKANKRGAPRRRRELGPRPRKKPAMSARESGGGFVSTAPLTSTATFFPLSNQTASTQMQLQGIHLFRMTDPVLSAQFGGI